MSAIDTRDAKLHHLYARASTKKGHKSHIDLNTEINNRMKTDHVIEEFTGKSTHMLAATKTPLPRNFDCLKKLISVYERYCGKMQDYDLKYVRHFVNECENLPTPAAIDSSVHRL